MKNLLLSLFLTVFTFLGFSQQSDLEVRKIRRIGTAYKDIHKLSYSTQQLNDSIIPILNQDKNSLAPHFPIEINFSSPIDPTSTSLKTWITDFPLEYQNYTVYLEKFIRKHL